MSAVKFVPEDKIPARIGHGTKKYQDLYEALQKKPGKWAEVTLSMKYTLSHRDNGKKTYPGVRTMKRGDRFFASFDKSAAAKHAPKAHKVKRTAKAGNAGTPHRPRSSKKGKRS